ncbi:hypothetical protein [Pseudomonas cedrina]|uniref:hypothetical protein n=1 Tax=Pseudomonas cedrina TaxID=651740 RepID=UPI00278B3B41|nr:hypothetical protein [Pseudomonas cedrina]MDQ0654007.1 hypothetical protein [Pseudomonas cedrina]
MKSLIALPLVALMLVSAQVSASCLYINESYTGIIPPKTAITAHGPFKITSANGCSGAGIDATVSTGGVGRAPEIYIEQEVGSSWNRVSFSIGNNASYSGAFGNYRVVLNNDDAVSKSYSGAVRYGR